MTTDQKSAPMGVEEWSRITPERPFELIGGIPHIAGQPVDPDAYREAMRLLEKRPAAK